MSAAKKGSPVWDEKKRSAPAVSFFDIVPGSKNISFAGGPIWVRMIKAERIKRLLKLPDLTKKANSPVKILFDQIIKLPRFKDFDVVEFPKIITVEQDFDLLNTAREMRKELLKNSF